MRRILIASLVFACSGVLAAPASFGGSTARQIDRRQPVCDIPFPKPGDPNNPLAFDIPFPKPGDPNNPLAFGAGNRPLTD
jgi:hypothetical protein